MCYIGVSSIGCSHDEVVRWGKGNSGVSRVNKWVVWILRHMWPSPLFHRSSMYAHCRWSRYPFAPRIFSDYCHVIKHVQYCCCQCRCVCDVVTRVATRTVDMLFLYTYLLFAEVRDRYDLERDLIGEEAVGYQKSTNPWTVKNAPGQHWFCSIILFWGVNYSFCLMLKIVKMRTTRWCWTLSCCQIKEWARKLEMREVTSMSTFS